MTSKFLPKKNYIYHLIIIIISFAFIYSSIFDTKVDTNGDNAGYYIMAKSIASNHTYSNIHHPTAEPANHFPPGYPFIMSVIFKTFGYDIGTVKLTNGLFFLLSLLVLFAFFKKLSNNSNLSFAAVLLILFNVHLLRFSTLMMSEIPFLFFSISSIYVFVLLDKEIPPLKNKLFYLFVILLSFSFYIRTAGIALFAGIILALVNEKKFKYIWTSLIGFLLLVLPWQIRSYRLGGNSYLSQLIQKNPYRPEMGTMDIGDWFVRFAMNFKRYLVREIPNSLFPHQSLNYQSAISYWDVAIGILLLVLIVYGFFQIKNHRLLILGYLLGSFGILLNWPEVWYGVRFLIPIIPLLLLFTCMAIWQLSDAITKKIKLKWKMANRILPMLFLFFILFWTYPQIKLTQQLAKIPYPMNYNNYLFIAKWAKTNTPKSAIICCRKDQLFYLFSDRKTVRYKNTLNKEELIRDLNDKKVDYVVLEQLGFISTPRYLYPAIQSHPNQFKMINHQKSPDTFLFKFEPEKE